MWTHTIEDYSYSFCIKFGENTQSVNLLDRNIGRPYNKPSERCKVIFERDFLPSSNGKDDNDICVETEEGNIFFTRGSFLKIIPVVKYREPTLPTDFEKEVEFFDGLKHIWVKAKLIGFSKKLWIASNSKKYSKARIVDEENDTNVLA